MNIGEKTNLPSEEYVINKIKNISQQLNSLNSLHKKDGNMETFNKDTKIQELQHYIEDLVGDLEKEDVSVSPYDAVSKLYDNNSLVISEKKGKIFLPYTVSELEAYVEEYSDEYKTLSDVVNQEFIVPIDKFKNQATSRFRETYCLMRDVEMKSVIESFKKAVEVMFNSKLNPMIICACKSEEQLKQYIHCAEHGNLDHFKGFKIVFEVSPFINKSSNFEEGFIIKSEIGNKGKHSK